ncbi:MAG TPA: sugar phosphate isomerase/epimerase family protein [Armatimonadota bacterium]|jgi:sugar phosphate isomerase/epimerase
MNYSFMTFSTPQLTLAENLALAQQLGYAGIEPRISAGHAHGIEFDTPAEQRAAIRRQAADSGIALCCLATSCRYADPATTQANTDDTLRSIDLAGDVGSPCLRVFGGNIPEGVSREQAADLLVAALRAVADQAQARGVTVCMETHDSWCDPAHVALVIERVNHPAIAVNWDIMHPIRVGGATMDSAFNTLQPWIRHLHIHDGTKGDPLVMLPIGEGDIDHRRAIELLQTINYSGFISGEWINWEPYETHLPRELAMLRGYEG